MLTVLNKNGIAQTPFMKGYNLGSRTVLTATGSSTYTVPNFCTLLSVVCVSSGAGGTQSANSTAGNINTSGGGVAGGIATAVIAVKPAQQFTAVVGAGGLSGNSGISSSLTDLVTGALVLSAVLGNTGNSSGVGATEVFVVGGNTGGGTFVGEYLLAGGGGSRGGAAHRVSGTISTNGKGAAGIFGGRPVRRLTQGTGATGGNYGASGSGGLSINAGGIAAGGAGGQGIIIIWEFYGN